MKCVVKIWTSYSEHPTWSYIVKAENGREAVDKAFEYIDRNCGQNLLNDLKKVGVEWVYELENL